MEVSFADPPALWALLVLPLFYVVHRRRPLHLSALAQGITLGVRLLIVLLLVLALARPRLAHPLNAVDVVFALDASQSVLPEQQTAAREWIRTALRAMGPRDQAGVVLFGSTAQVEQPLGQDQELRPFSSPPASATNVEQALRLASSLFPRPAARRIVLLSDGAQNLGQAAEEARAAAAAGVSISAVPLLSPPPVPEVIIEGLESPPRVREGENFDVSVLIYSTTDTQATLRFWADGRLVGQEVVVLEGGPNRFVYHQVASRPGFHPFRARVDAPADTWPQNNDLSSFTVVGEKGRVLLIEGLNSQPGALIAALTAASVDVEVRPPSTIPANLAALGRYDALVLYNVPATALSVDQQKTIQAYVRSLGRGLLVIGGKQSYSLGGYAGTPLEETLPVSMTPPSQRENPSLALVLVIDKSGSMDAGGRADLRGGATGSSKIAMAKEAAIQAMEILDVNDLVGVLAFDLISTWLTPLQELADPGALPRIRMAINSLYASGGTEMYPAVQAAFEAIRSSPAQLKHIVLLTDGRSYADSDYTRIMGRLQADGITLSAIAIGADADKPLLRRLSEQGSGRYYYTDDARNIPKLLTEEATTARARRIVSSTFRPKITAPSPAVDNFVAQDLPQLNGYIATSLKSAARMVLASPADDPVLAQWQYGLGRAVAWTSDVESAWGGEWLAWNELPRFWAQAARYAMPSPLEGELQLNVALERGRATIIAEAVTGDGSYSNLLDSRAAIVSPGSNRFEIALRQTAPGRYEGKLSVSEEGAYLVEVVQQEAGRPVRSQTFGFVVPYSPEYRLNRDGERVLQSLVTETGGQFFSDPREVFQPDPRPARREEEAWPLLLGLALLLFPLDVGLRRLWPAGSLRPWLAGWRKAIRGGQD